MPQRSTDHPPDPLRPVSGSADRPADPNSAVLRTICAPGPSADSALAELLEDPDLEWGALLATAVDNKAVCLLADHLARIPRPRALSWHMARLLESSLRTNRYKTTVFRRETLRVLDALHDAGLRALALHGIAVESRLYGGRGARQFSDADILLAPEDHAPAITVLHGLGYRVAHHGRALALTLDDPIVPRVTVDLTQSLAHTNDPAELRHSLDRSISWPLPDGCSRLAVLSDLDALAHHLARLASSHRWSGYADAIRSFHSCGPDSFQLLAFVLPSPARDGWDQLRREWPDLPDDPIAALHDDVTTRGDQP
ncbi:nucleotidyltransferase family protein [Yinghuangia sp. ASG 101]|uniref:nucleotidyltransferase family protein n=1 Tax=Yinghuangia sp. ASG 101 TaxID=2896848 RepID=UPI001E52916B|nr:nucleotidyltransferase family protein [Yinghuangia sp. ASG 101]UGQ10495.1 nucleotidyltransferase family protein [Yinghuangia sp. ASG 101]